jgi:hypothetical protein
MSGAIPVTYADWLHCIEVECRIPLTREFADARLAALRDLRCEETRRFIARYGATHHGRVVAWFEAWRSAN